MVHLKVWCVCGGRWFGFVELEWLFISKHPSKEISLFYYWILELLKTWIHQIYFSKWGWYIQFGFKVTNISSTSTYICYSYKWLCICVERTSFISWSFLHRFLISSVFTLQKMAKRMKTKKLQIIELDWVIK